MIDDDTPTTMREFEMIQQLRSAVGLFVGAMPISPKEAWEEALKKARRFRELHDDVLSVWQKSER